jgi:hypothetical protein
MLALPQGYSFLSSDNPVFYFSKEIFLRQFYPNLEAYFTSIRFTDDKALK